MRILTQLSVVNIHPIPGSSHHHVGLRLGRKTSHFLLKFSPAALGCVSGFFWVFFFTSEWIDSWGLTIGLFQPDWSLTAGVFFGSSVRRKKQIEDFECLTYCFVEQTSLLEHSPERIVHERFTAVQARGVFFPSQLGLVKTNGDTDLNWIPETTDQTYRNNLLKVWTVFLNSFFILFFSSKYSLNSFETSNNFFNRSLRVGLD